MAKCKLIKVLKPFVFLFISVLATYLEGASQTTIHMKREGGVSIVPCKINGLDLLFVFDTGASDVSISLTEAIYMIKHGLIKENDILGISYYSDASGNTSKCYVVNIRSLEFAGLKLVNVRASIVNDMNAPLLLGQSALSKLGPIQLDLSTNTLIVLNGKGNYDYTKNSNTFLANQNNSPEKIGITDRNSAPVDISVKDYEGNPIPYAFIVFETTTTKIKFHALCNDLGNTSTRLPVGYTYKVTFIAKDKINSDELLDIPQPNGNSYYKNPFKVDIQYSPTRTLVLEDCEYSKNEYILTAINYSRLNTIVEYMTTRPNTIISLTGIANKSESNKLKLIENRMDAVTKYLLGHGINASRIKVNRSSQLNSNTNGIIKVNIN